MVQGLAIRQKGAKKRRIVRGILLVICVAAVAAFGWAVYQWYMHGTVLPIPSSIVNNGVSESPVTKKQIEEYQVPPEHPRYISIPSLSIKDTRVIAVGVTKNGELDVPKNIYDAAWYEKSALPGSGSGAVMIDAHSGGYANDGIFTKLGQLKDGDQVIVTRGDNKTITYRVASVVNMPLDQVNKTGMNEMMQPVDPSKEGLSLITCSGNYVPRLGQFDHRIMVRAIAEQQA